MWTVETKPIQGDTVFRLNVCKLNFSVKHVFAAYVLLLFVFIMTTFWPQCKETQTPPHHSDLTFLWVLTSSWTFWLWLKLPAAGHSLACFLLSSMVLGSLFLLQRPSPANTDTHTNQKQFCPQSLTLGAHWEEMASIKMWNDYSKHCKQVRTVSVFIWDYGFKI